MTEVADVDGVLQVSTKGDANSNPDAWTLEARRTTFYEYRGQSALLGAFVQHATAVSRQLLWAVPILVLVLYALRRIGRPSRAHTPKHAAVGSSRRRPHLT